MFGFFKKKTGDDGVLSNLKTVSRWLNDLPAGDMYSAQEKVVQHLIRFNQTKQGFSRDRLQALMHLDEETREIQESLCLQYLRNSRMSRAMEARLWTAIHAFYWEVTRGYHSFLMDFIADPGGSKVQAQVPRITARAVRGFADIIKWRYFRYERMDEKLWLRLHNLYRIAEFDRFAHTRITVYPGEHRASTVAEEYGQALLLSPFGSGTLAPREIEMVDRWLDNWAVHVRIDDVYDADQHAFCVDTGRGVGVIRCGPAGGEGNLRYVRTRALLDRLQEVRASLQQGIAPAALGLTEDFRVPEGYSLIKQVESAWSLPREGERRHDDRVESGGQWKVIHGLAGVCRELAKAELSGQTDSQLSPEEVLDIKLYGFVTERTKERLADQARESDRRQRKDVWSQHDGSASGLGFLVDHRDCEWVKVGKLVAVSPLDEEHWHIGVVSRMASKDQGNRLVGVKLFSEHIQAVSLKVEEADSGLGYVVDDLERPLVDPDDCALLLQDVDDEQLIIDSGRYSRDRKFVLRLPRADSRVVRLDTVSDSGEAWLRVDFSLVAV